MKAILLVCIISAVFCMEAEWLNFVATYNKVYPSQREFNKRRQIFMDNLKMIKAHNNDPQYTYTLGINTFADLSYEEFAALYLNSIETVENLPNEPRSNDKLKEIDWRKEGAVTRVKDQNPCGSCYSFSATGVMESRAFMALGTLYELSDQECVDCGIPEGNLGCQGGLKEQCFRTYQRLGGLMYEKDYPYTKRYGNCKFDKSKGGISLVNYTNFDTEKKNQIELENGPIGISIYASNKFQLINSPAVFIDSTCPNTTTNHAMLMVGMGTMDGQDYYIIKNSWGTGWGDKGYYKHAANHNNMCTIGSRGWIPTGLKQY